MKELKNTFIRGFFFCLLLIAVIPVMAQQEVKSDSLFAARLMQDNLELYSKIDSLSAMLKTYQSHNGMEKRQIDSMKVAIAQCYAQLNVKDRQTDTLESQRLRLSRNLVELKSEMLDISTRLEDALQQIRNREFQLKDCEVKLRDAQAEGSLKAAKLEGKNDVSNAKLEAKDREILYLNESIVEKDRIIAEKTAELNKLYTDKSNSLRILDSLARELNSHELELARVSERLRIIEGQYNDMCAAKAAAQNKKKKVRFVQGIAFKNYRTPDYQLTPQSSSTTATYVITNKNAGKIEIDYITGVSLSLYDLTKPDSKYTSDVGLFFGFGGTNFLKNFYISPSYKAFDYFHFMLGLNVAEYEQLQSGFSEGDALPPGMSIPTVKQWKANLFFSLTIDFDLLSNIPKKI